jgi:chitosanase
MILTKSALLPFFLASLAVSAREVPANLKAFYDAHKSTPCASADRLSPAFQDGQSKTNGVYYCAADAKNSSSQATRMLARKAKKPSDGGSSHIMYIKGSGSNYADMDIDCDGANRKEGWCGDDTSGQDDTAFQDVLKGYGTGVDQLDAHIHTYVVLGNSDDSPSFDPQSVGIEPLSVVAVVCGDKLVSVVMSCAVEGHFGRSNLLMWDCDRSMVFGVTLTVEWLLVRLHLPRRRCVSAIACLAM